MRQYRYSFRPRARLLQILGDQLIRDPRIGVFELVKNAYDADSPSAEVIFRDITDPATASIEVRDSGDGMDLATVREIWLEPGADHRMLQREEGIRTKRFERLPLGEKGVGRFAAHKLGNKIKLVTRKKGSQEIEVTIDWNQLTGENRYLTKAPVRVVTRDPVVFKRRGPKATGTVIIIEELRHNWTRGDVRKLFRSVNAISSPYDKNYGFAVDFRMEPDPGWLEGLLNPSDVLAQAMFYYSFTLEKSQFDFAYEFRPLPGLQQKGLNSRKINKENQPLEFFVYEIDEESGKKKKRKATPDLDKYGIGRIVGEIYGFDRDKKILSLYATNQSGLEEYLNSQGGIRVYRGGIRVYDYGEPENDWLGLDERRVQFPARRISNNLVLGQVHLTLEESTDLIEKTNREGFVENAAYEEFKNAVRSAVVRFEVERAIDKDRIRDLLEDTPGPLGKMSGPEEAISALRQKVMDTGQEKVLGQYVDKVEFTYKEMRDNLLDAVGSGLGLATVFHEIERGVRDLYKSINHNAAIEHIQEMAKSLVELLQGASYFVRTSSRKKHKVSDVIKHAIFSNSLRFKFHKIEIVNAFENNAEMDFEFYGSRKMITASVVNLIDNAIYWLNLYQSTKDGAAKKRIWLGGSRDLEGPAIVVADNGPGFEDDPSMLIRPFFTRKQDGMGLGLYFVNLTMQAHAGRLDFPAPGEISIPKAYGGAVLAMVFKGEKT